MSSIGYLRQFAGKCNRISADIADEAGFVSVRLLLERFGARLLLRPLLVEGMLASTERDPSKRGGDTGHQWCLLLDSETHNVTEAEIANERFGVTLPVRLRNTVAHELAHCLAFRAQEFGIELRIRFESAKSKRDWVAVIEKETEKLSPLLLCPDRLLDRIFSPDKERISVEELSALGRAIGISRYVLVNRLNLLRLSDEKRLLARPAINNVAVGIAEWISDCEATFKTWPLYAQFEGGKVPGFIFQLQRGIPVSPSAIFSDSRFLLSDCPVNITECLVGAGTPKNPAWQKLPIRCSVETGQRKPGSEFLFVVQLVGDTL